MTNIEALKSRIKGDVFNDFIHKRLYATDASVYREEPMAVAFPADEEDLHEIVLWANENRIPLIPRAAGTSLAGQVVGNGVVIDTGRFMNRIIEINAEEKTVWVQPGVIRDDLNRELKPYGLFFAPETSTSNRCMIGGMVGNNACGAHSLIYGSTRDHLLEVKGFFADGSYCHTRPLIPSEFKTILEEESLEGDVYRFLDELFVQPDVRSDIEEAYPWPEIRRRNTGYALDLVMKADPWSGNGAVLNLSTLIAGSEGTLIIMSAVKLALVELPPPVTVLLCAHFRRLDEAFDANILALKHDIFSIELIDNVIIECTASHVSLKSNRFFIKGEPEAVLLIELCGESVEELILRANNIASEIQGAGYGYHFPVLSGKDVNRVWELRKAGLGLLANVEGTAKPVAVVEDTAVRPVDLPAYMAEFRQILDRLQLSCVFYAHISTGELHLKPLLDLKNPEHLILFRKVAEETAHLVKKYRGSLSGEHGDGRLRSEFISIMVGEKISDYYVKLKKTFDPKNILNPGKITSALPMDSGLRYSGLSSIPEIKPMFRYPSDGGFIQAVERCTGSGDCRRPSWHGGVMCPSYQATKDERLSTRGRANLIREAVSRPGTIHKSEMKELKAVLDQCLSCKGCQSECPGGVDLARYKAELMNIYYQNYRTPLSVRLVVNLPHIIKLFRFTPWIYNSIVSASPLSAIVKSIAGFHPKRSLPKISAPSLDVWLKRNKHILAKPSQPGKGHVVFYADEFTSSFDAKNGIKAICLLLDLGYRVTPFQNGESGRAAFSKGKLKHAKRCAERNINRLKQIVTNDMPLVGIEPSALLSFKDEYPDIVDESLADSAVALASNTYLIEDFIIREFEKGNITQEMFIENDQQIVFHGHCHQKAVNNTGALKKMLELPKGYSAEEIRSGCCGMAGSFGMEKRNYHLSMSIGEQILFPFVRNLGDGTIVAWPGAGCRQQLLDGTGIKALHPVEILSKALVNNRLDR